MNSNGVNLLESIDLGICFDIYIRGVRIFYFSCGIDGVYKGNVNGNEYKWVKLFIYLIVRCSLFYVLFYIV